MELSSEVVIDGVTIGKEKSPYVIAEISGNHAGDINRAIALIKAAASAGAQAVKLQTYTADTMTIDCQRSEFTISDKGSLWYGRQLYDLYQEASTPWEWHAELFAAAKEEGITIFSTPFDITAVDFLEELAVPCYKISSFECTDLRLIKYIAQTGKPVIMSTGTASLSEIMKSVEVLKENGCHQLILLICVSEYPAPAESIRLERMSILEKLFGCPVGLSDHSLGLTVPITAIGAGATTIEKHFTLDDGLKTVDSDFSLTESELKSLCKEVKYAGAARNGGFAFDNPKTKAKLYRRSIYFVSDLKEGQLITERDIKTIRPSLGLETVHYEDIVGKKAAKDIPFGTPTSWDLIC